MGCCALLASLVRDPTGIAGQSSTVTRGRRHVPASLFLVCKTLLALAIAGFMTAATLRPLSSGTVQVHAYLVPYLLAYRWSMRDQAKRCPICFRRMGNPVQIGTWPTIFLDWFGKEYMCRLGHGFLYEPIVETGFSSQRWAPLDPSWKDLFTRNGF